VRVVCCKVEVSGTGRSLVYRSPTGCDVSGCGLENLTVRRVWPTGTVESLENTLKLGAIYTLYDVNTSNFYLINIRHKVKGKGKGAPLYRH